MAIQDRRLQPEQLRASFDPATLSFDCTDELAPLTEFVGQDRATRSLEFGLGLRKPGYNVFVTGLTGTGKASAILEYIRREVTHKGAQPPLQDWCYVYNFDDPDRPNAIGLPAGMGKRLREQMDALLTGIRTNLTRVFSSDEYERQRRAVFDEGTQHGQALIEEAQRHAADAGFILNFLPSGPAIVPQKDGRAMTPEEFSALTVDERHEITERERPVDQLVAEVGEKLRALERDVASSVQTMDRSVVETTVKAPFEALAREFEGEAEVTEFIARLREFTLASADFLRQLATQTAPPAAVSELPAGGPPDPFLPFRVNLFVDNSDATEPPIIIEPNPTWTNLFGRIERRAYLGTYLSDHTMLKPGSAHRANGGYLILNLTDLTSRPGAWEGLRRMIRTGLIQLEDQVEQLGIVQPQTLRPEPIPSDEKVVVAGDAMSYSLLSAYDDQFWELFKVRADFDYEISRDHDHALAYGRFVCAVCEREHLRHFDRTAVAQLIEYGSREVEDQEKLSSRFGRLRDVIIEADYWAGRDGQRVVSGKHVDEAIEERVYRGNLIEERIREMIARGTLIIDTSGAVVGQVNGLAVLQFGDISFGRATRITARTYLGQRGVVSIDRESQLSGKIHDKGVLILSGYLGWQYGRERPLSLSATISFEQGYDTIDGDSASLGETCAILSAIAGLPLRQDLAITGSVNQNGDVQPIGGANYKIEGFHDLCRVTGFSGTQGVILPTRNLKNLMLREDVVQSVRDGNFSVYAVSTVDEALEILTGLPAGERAADGNYPEGSIHQLIEKHLDEMGEAMRGSGHRDATSIITTPKPDSPPPPKPPEIPA
jgi:predicted ATP-dependent protease